MNGRFFMERVGDRPNMALEPTSLTVAIRAHPALAVGVSSKIELISPAIKSNRRLSSSVFVREPS
jgi:hypothetical protein